MNEYAVLLYPPFGSPRVVEVPAMPKGFKPVATFKTQAKASKALEKFLTDNPEYRKWKDGKIQA